MKRFLTAAAAVSLLAAGAAYAQTGPTGSGGAQPTGGDTSAQPGAPTGQTGDATQGGTGGAGSMSGGSMSGGGMTGGDQGGATSGGAMGAGQMGQTGETPAPASGGYPPCTSRSQDHCTQTGAMKASSRKAAASGRHHSAHATKFTSTQ